MEGKGYVYMGCCKVPCKVAGDKVTLHKSDINRALKALQNSKATIDKAGGEYCNSRLLEMELVEDRIYYNGMIDVLKDLARCFK